MLYSIPFPSIVANRPTCKTSFFGCSGIYYSTL
uniref:Uncharacterized protein n=1 Tax=Rhizophora mucronata TaxID=61149 RepID=A0A2P2LAV6_RHIMU